LCVVQYALSNPTIQTVVGGRIFQTFQFVPLAFKAEARRG